MQSKLLGACALFMTILVTGCGSGTSSAVATTTPSPAPLVTESVGSLSAGFLNEIAALESVDQPESSATANFQTAGTDTAFPLTDGDSIARSANGQDLAILFEQASVIPAETSFVVRQEITWIHPRGVCGTVPVGTCGMLFEGTPNEINGVYTFSVDLTVTAGTVIGVIFNQQNDPDGERDASTYDGMEIFEVFRSAVAPAEFDDRIRTNRAPREAAEYHVWEFETNDVAVNDIVATVIASVRVVADEHRTGSGFVTHTVPFTVKGARDTSATGINGRSSDSPLAAFFIESQYSAIGWWMSHPDLFFDSGEAWGATSLNGVLHYGLATAEAGRPTSGTATYSGVASGTYLRNEIATTFTPGEDGITRGGNGFAGTDRFIVGGQVTLAADFAGGSVGGTVALTAYSLDYSTLTGTPAGSTVDIVLTAGAIDGASFSGNNVAVTNQAGVFEDLAAFDTDDDGMATTTSLLSGIFSGLFTGTSAQEMVGQARLETAPAYTITDAVNTNFVVARDTNDSPLYIITEAQQTIPGFTNAAGETIPERIIPERVYVASGPTGGHPSPVQVLYMVPTDQTSPATFTQTERTDILEFGFVTRQEAAPASP